MHIRTEITPGELDEAIRLNRNRMYWPKFFLANWYSSILLIAISWATVVRLLDGKSLQPATFGLLLIPVFFLWLYWFRTQKAIRDAASQLSDTNGSASVDGKGLSTSSSKGATSFSPWSEFSGWKEGKEVFTLNQGTTFRVFPKRGLTEPEMEQLRSVFRTQIS